MKNYKFVPVSEGMAPHTKRILKNGVIEEVTVNQPYIIQQFVDLSKYTAEKLREIRKQETNFKGEPRR